MQNKILHDKLAELFSQIIEIILMHASNRGGLSFHQETNWISNNNKHYYMKVFPVIFWQPVISELESIFKN